jgi:FtsH-binding integral membrane protein
MQDNLSYQAPVAQMAVAERSNFIWKCYAHVVGAVLAFAAISAYLYTSGISEIIAAPMLGNWFLVLGAFILVGWGASHTAHRVQSTAAQYAALAVFVFAEAIIFAPLLLVAEMKAPGTIDSAAGVTILGSVGLIATAMITRKDFSFLRGLLVWGFFIAIAIIIAGALFGFALGTWFSVAMIGFAGAAVLYDTSNILHHYPQDKYVAASLELFASIALMFWYVLQLFMSRD